MMGRIAILYSRRKLLRSSVATAAALALSSSATINVAAALILPRHCTLTRMFSTETKVNETPLETNESWSDVLPFSKSSHRSAKITIPAEPDDDDAYDESTFRTRLESTIVACQELGKSSIWVEVPMARCSLIEKGDMEALGFQFHHAVGEKAVLNLWLKKDTESKVPEFATHNVGVGAVVVNSRDEILCVREIRKNYMPWKTPTGLSELGEQIDEAAVREVLEETGIRTKFHSILSFRQTHGLAHDRSDLFFVCRLDPIERVDENGNVLIETPTAQTCEIEKAEWVPLSEYREMVNDKENGHPMMRHVIEMYDNGKRIEKNMVHSVIPGRTQPNAMYFPSIEKATDTP